METADTSGDYGDQSLWLLKESGTKLYNEEHNDDAVAHECCLRSARLVVLVVRKNILDTKKVIMIWLSWMAVKDNEG